MAPTAQPTTFAIPPVSDHNKNNDITKHQVTPTLCCPIGPLYNAQACLILQDEYCCLEGVTSMDPFCAAPQFLTVNCSVFDQCPLPIFTTPCSTFLNGVWAVNASTAGSQNQIAVVVFSGNSVSLFAAQNGLPVPLGQWGAYCQPQSPGLYQVQLFPQANVVAKGTVNVTSDGLSFSLNVWSQCQSSHQATSYSYREPLSFFFFLHFFFLRFLRLSYFFLFFFNKEPGASSCNAPPPMCSSISNCTLIQTPTCNPQPAPNLSTSYVAACLAQTSAASCALNSCNWSQQTCVVSNCNQLVNNASVCNITYGCQVSAIGCVTASNRFTQPCPFSAQSSLCLQWDKCLPTSTTYDATWCAAALAQTCCSTVFFSRPPACSTYKANFTCGTCDETGWGTCPSIITTGLWTSSLVQFANPAVSQYASPLWQFGFNGKNGILSRSFPPQAPVNPSTLGSSFPVTVRCRGDFTTPFDIDLVLGGNQNLGFIARGTAFPSPAPTGQGFITANSTIVLVFNTADSCSRPPPANQTAGAIALGQSGAPPPVAGGTNCNTPITVSLPSLYSGPLSRLFSIAPQVVVAPCAQTVVYNPTFRWLISPSPQ